ncbi:hypothetical protein O988_02278 [Pseudogymnoascus sp. VKM F-3808]|nr:hypothetical protein O988_02278 [Pseudogymnoascus sp. VKM F-3808]
MRVRFSIRGQDAHVEGPAAAVEVREETVVAGLTSGCFYFLNRTLEFVRNVVAVELLILCRAQGKAHLATPIHHLAREITRLNLFIKQEAWRTRIRLRRVRLPIRGGHAGMEGAAPAIEVGEVTVVLDGAAGFDYFFHGADEGRGVAAIVVYGTCRFSQPFAVLAVRVALLGVLVPIEAWSAALDGRGALLPVGAVHDALDVGGVVLGMRVYTVFCASASGAGDVVKGTFEGVGVAEFNFESEVWGVCGGEVDEKWCDEEAEEQHCAGWLKGLNLTEKLGQVEDLGELEPPFKAVSQAAFAGIPSTGCYTR